MRRLGSFGRLLRGHARSWIGVLVLFGILCSATALIVGVVEEARAAPAPFPRPARPLTRASLVGTWTMYWGTVRSSVTLSANGDYECIWPGAVYVGTWGYDSRGRFWITESYRPEVASSWQSYSIQLGKYRRAGRITTGAEGIVVRLEAMPAREWKSRPGEIDPKWLKRRTGVFPPP